MILENHEITTVVSDFDGTLIRPGTQELTPQFYKVAQQLLDCGIRFIAASGRQYPNMRRLMAPIADRIGFIAENGALIVWKGQVLHKCIVPRPLAMELITDMGMESNSEILVSGEGTSYIVPNDPAYADMLENTVHNVVTVLPSFLHIPEEMLKVSIWYPDGIPAASERLFREKYEKHLLVVESGNGWLDFIPRDSGKGRALRFLSRRMGFDLAQTAAFGDSENDIIMLQIAGVSYAMNHARQPVKAAAGFTCDSVEDILENALHSGKNNTGRIHPSCRD